MADIMSADQRSARMQKIRSQNTGPELKVRRSIFKMGYRYRINVRNLPGKPDIVFPSRRKVIFVHGCFWHLHQGCRDGRIPQTRIEYWEPKLTRTRERDEANIVKLKDDGWKVLIIWECELNVMSLVEEKIIKFLNE